MERIYDAYKAKVVHPFFKDDFSHINCQIVLIDLLSTLHKGPEAIEDLRKTMSDILSAFRSKQNSLLSRMFTGPKIDRIVFAATKADHLHQAQHEKLATLIQILTDGAARLISWCTDIGDFFGKPTIHYRGDAGT